MSRAAGMEWERYVDVPEPQRTLSAALSLNGSAVVNPHKFTAQAERVMEYMGEHGYLIVHRDDIEPIAPHRWTWRWKR